MIAWTEAFLWLFAGPVRSTNPSGLVRSLGPSGPALLIPVMAMYRLLFLLVLAGDAGHTRAQTAAFQWLFARPVRSPMCQRRLWHIGWVLRKRLSLDQAPRPQQRVRDLAGIKVD